MGADVLGTVVGIPVGAVDGAHEGVSVGAILVGAPVVGALVATSVVTPLTVAVMPGSSAKSVDAIALLRPTELLAERDCATDGLKVSATAEIEYVMSLRLDDCMVTMKTSDRSEYQTSTSALYVDFTISCSAEVRG